MVLVGVVEMPVAVVVAAAFPLRMGRMLVAALHPLIRFVLASCAVRALDTTLTHAPFPFLLFLVPQDAFDVPFPIAVAVLHVAF